MCCHEMNRRQFIGLTAAGVAGAGLVASDAEAQSFQGEQWDPQIPFKRWGKPLRVQPVLLYNTHKPRAQTSWRPWGGLHSQDDVAEEMNRIGKELSDVKKRADFPLQMYPVVKVQNKEQAMAVASKSDHDVMFVYAASGGGDALEACYAGSSNNLMFVRHRSGPVYLWYEIAHCRFLRKGGDAFQVDEYRDPAGMDVHDVIVDDTRELMWKLRAIHGKENFVGKKIITLGGASGWCCPQAPLVGKEKFALEMINVPYEIMARRIQAARNDKKLVSQCKQEATRYLDILDTELETERPFVENAFLLYHLFKQLMTENDADAFTINHCMGTIIPMAETTACLTLSLLNDEGYMAFCESDFNVIPSGLLLYHIAGKPVFLNDPTYPHHGCVTCAHCTAPRRMDAENYAPARIMTHFESDYGATPKVNLPKGTQVTMVCPDAGQKTWVGFTGKIVESPFYDICRSQYDIEIDGNWRKLLQDMRGFHWNMVLGDYSREMDYACRKLKIEWNNISAV